MIKVELCLSTLFNLSCSHSDEAHSAEPVQVGGGKFEKKKNREEKLFGGKAQWLILIQQLPPIFSGRP